MHRIAVVTAVNKNIPHTFGKKLSFSCVFDKKCNSKSTIVSEKLL